MQAYRPSAAELIDLIFSRSSKSGLHKWYCLMPYHLSRHFMVLVCRLTNMGRRP